MGTSLRGTLFIAIISSVLAACHADVCCFPSQFEGHIIDMEPTGNQNEPYTQTDIDVSFDWTKNRLRQYVAAEDYLQLQFFGKGVMYTIQNSTCKVSKLFPPPNGTFCIPDNAKRMKSYTLGIKEKISAIDYLITEKESQILRTISDMCVPVADIYFPLASNDFSTIITYQNLTSGIKDEKVFDVPSFCKSNEKKNISPPMMKASYLWKVSL
ncbi:ependymin-2-like [Ruditapes philippinarum]|uniref:ependymin-2-like n=1 Tax=Ruditapes philippinarum TaxID=129788 RepID=UPI00295C25BB|nr:ependymin-2-like [Ruditapes philippinarum]